MTIISAVIRQTFIIVATDSLLAAKQSAGTVINKESFPGKPKFVAFPKIRCIASYWGVASILGNSKKETWTTYDWLKSKVQIQSNFSSMEDFGEHLKEDLTRIFGQYNFKSYRMLGIHLTGFEWFNNKWIPELFLVIGDSNNKNFNCSRRTYFDLDKKEDIQLEIAEQREVYYDRIKDGYSIYNNGDNEMFNHFCNSFHNAIKSTQNKSQLKGGLSKSFFLDLATLPIKQVVYFQNKYYTKDAINVGGKVHTICMNSDGFIDSIKSNR